VNPFLRPRPLREGDRVAGFDCGVRALDDWLHARAWRSHMAGGSRVYVATTADDEDRVIAYYALCAGAARRAPLPGSVRRNMPDPVPVAVLARLAVDRRFQGAGLRSALLADAVRRVHQAAAVVGMRALVVDAWDGAESFYERLGFTAFPPGSGRFVAPLQHLAASIAKAASPPPPAPPTRDASRQARGRPAEA
jgi:GNAT superfamily N-acetyltransferase